DQHPTKVFEVLKKGFYRAALFFRLFVQAFRFGFIHHSWNRSANQTLVPGEDWETVGCDSTCGWAFSAVKRLGGGGGGVSSIELVISSVTSRVAFLNSLMPDPRPLASSGSFFAPNKMSTTAKISTISQPPSIP